MAQHRTISRRSLLAGTTATVAATTVKHSSAFAAPTVIQGGPIEISYWHINSDTFGGPATTEIVNRFQEANPDIRVNHVFQQNSYTGLLENLQASLAAGSPPDVAQIGYLYLDYVYSNLPYVAPETLIDGYGSDDFLSGFADNIITLGTTRGQLMGIPFAISAPLTYFNADLFTEAGLDPEKPPVTTADWWSAAEQIKDQTDKVGLYIQLLNDNWTLDGLIGSNGVSLLECDDTGTTAIFDSPEGIEALTWWADLVANGYSLNVLSTEGQPAFLAGEAAAFVTTPALRAAIEAQAPFVVRATQHPRWGQKELSLPTGGNTLVTFSPDPAKQEATWKFIEYLYTPESMNLWIQGTGYLPPRADAAEPGTELAEFIESNQIQGVAVSQVPYARRWITFPGPTGLEAQQVLFAATQAALGGQQDAGAALSEAAATINSMIAGEPCLE